MKPNIVGSKQLYLNPGLDTLATADIGLIDEAFAPQTISPYAYTSTVRDDYDSVNIYFTAAGSSLVTGQQFAVGLFLSPDNDKHNLLFQLSGQVNLFFSSATTIGSVGRFFFGRKATNNTVTSSKAGVNNTLANFIQLNPRSFVTPGITVSTGGNPMKEGLETDVFGLELAGGYCWCFGFQIMNPGAGTDVIKGMISLSMRKYSTGISAFKPSYV